MSVMEKVEVTPEELLALPEGKFFELVEGELKERHLSTLTSLLAIRLSSRLNVHVETNHLGWVFDAENGYQCFPNSSRTVRKPDISFVKLDRLKPEEIGDGWLKIVPDLVVEIVSPHDTSYEVEAKLEEYRRVGVPLIWVIVPPIRSVRVIRGTKGLVFHDGDELSGEDIIPGFSCRVADLFLPVG